MVDSISGISSGMMPMSMGATSLTEEQKTTLQDIIAKYDPANMTDEDRKAMMEEIRAAQIPPGKDTRDIMDAAGIEMGPPPGGKPPMDGAQSSQESGETNSVQQMALELLQQLQGGDLSEDDLTAFLQSLVSQGYGSTGVFFDTQA